MPDLSKKRWPTLAVPVLAVAAMFSSPNRVRAQDNPDQSTRAQLVGAVIDRQTGDPIPSARVNISRLDDGVSAWSGIADEEGEFRTSLLSLGEYQVEVEAPPHVPVSQGLQLSEAGVIDVRVEMVGVDYQLDPIVAVARRQTRLQREGFYDRVEQGLGDYLTRADIEAVQPMWTTDLFRQMPGVRVQLGSTPRQDTVVLARRGGCVPIMVVDNVPINTGVPLGLLNERYNPYDFEAIEVYRGQMAPARYGPTDCGVVMFWTREPLAGSRLLPSLKKVAIGAGLVGLAFVLTR